MTGDAARCAVATLVDAVRDGDTRAFERLYREHVAEVARVAARYQRDRALVADVVQETFLRAFEQLDSLHSPQRFRSWLLTIARNVAVDQGRRRARRAEVLGDQDEEAESQDPGPAELAELAELASAVHGCVAGLSPRDAAAITLVTRFGLSPSETAIALGVTPATARVILHRARKRLQAVLTAEVVARSRGVTAVTVVTS